MEGAPSRERRRTLRELLVLFADCRPFPRHEREAALVSERLVDDEQALLTFALALSDAQADELYGLMDALEQRAVAAQPDAPELSPDELFALHAAFNSMPAQLHPALLGMLGDAHRAATALALGLAPREVALSLYPSLGPLLLLPDARRAAAAAEVLLDDADRAALALAAFRDLPLSAQAAVASELPPAALAFCVLAASPQLEPSQLGATWRTLAALGSESCPAEAPLGALHALLQTLSAASVGRVARALGDVGSLIEAAPHLDATRWVPLTLSMRTADGRLLIDARRISTALLRQVPPAQAAVAPWD